MMSMKMNLYATGGAVALRILSTLYMVFMVSEETEFMAKLRQNMFVYPELAEWGSWGKAVVNPARWVFPYDAATAGVMTKAAAYLHALFGFAVVVMVILTIVNLVMGGKKEAAPVEADSETSGEE